MTMEAVFFLGLHFFVLFFKKLFVCDRVSYPQTQHVAKGDLDLPILLPLPPELWD